MSGFEVHAVRYGSREGRRGEHFLGYDEDAHTPHPTAYYVWLAVSAEHTVVIDAGMRAERARSVRGLDYVDPVDLLAEFGIATAAVDHLVLTHLHYDHAGTAAAFPAATRVLQQSEVDYWTGPWAKRITHERWLLDEVALDRLRAEPDRLLLLDGDAEVVPGLSVHLVGGHTAGMQVVRVETGHGTVVLASDAAHFYENLDDDRPAPLPHSMTGVYAAFDRIRELGADIVVPGHDPGVLERYPPSGPGFAGRIARVA